MKYCSVFGLTLLVFVICDFNSLVVAQQLPSATSNLFSGSGNCALCHSAGNGAFQTQSNTDISPITLWRSTMMANAAKDPFWQAKVKAEVVEHPDLQFIIEDKCLTCHAPMGRTEAIYNGASQFFFSEAMNDDLSMDGVSCTLCHQVQAGNLGAESFSGKYQISNVHEIFGPYQSPLSMPMFNAVGFTPVFSDHVHLSELCATCHTLFTPYLDNEGQIAGTFPEQVPYLEWKNSIYPEENKQCQTCHMPAVEEAMKISSFPPMLSTLRSPVWKHDFVGANIFMNDMFKTHGEEIGLSATQAQLDSTGLKTLNMLQSKSIQLTAEGSIIGDTLLLEIKVENVTGHKFPTGFPSRQAWLHVMVENENNEFFFESGAWNDAGEVVGIDNEFEPHYHLITDENQVQVYQAVMQDVDENVTYTLLRGASYIKDNRLPPKGFTTLADDYESMAIAGYAAGDPDFNVSPEGVEGTGADIIYFKIPIAGKGVEFNITVEMRYQTLSSQFAQHLFEQDIEKVTQFKQYYEVQDKTPVLIQSISYNVINTSVGLRSGTIPEAFKLLKNYPNPFNASTVIQYSVVEPGFIFLEIYDIRGRKIKTLSSTKHVPGTYTVIWDGKDDNHQTVPSGVYLSYLQLNNKNYSSRLLLLR